MSFWQNFSELFSCEAKKYKTVFIPDYRVDVDYDTTPIKAGEAYCRLILVEMRLSKQIDWFKARYPVVHSAIRFNYGGDKVTVPYLAGPGFIRDLTQENLDRVIPCNHYLTPLFPFNQGEVEIQVGLFSMVANDPITKFITTIGRFTALLPVPELSTVLNLTEPVYKGIEDLIGIGDSCLNLGYQQTFSEAGGGGGNDLRAGYFVVILAEDQQIDSNVLCVVNDSLGVASPGKVKAFLRNKKTLDGYSYMLFRIEKRTAQDWESLGHIKDLVYKAQDAVAEGKYSEVKSNLLPAIRIAVFRSPDVAKIDRKPMILKIEEALKEFGLQSNLNRKQSLYTIMQRPTPVIGSTTEAELNTLERVLEEK